MTRAPTDTHSAAQVIVTHTVPGNLHNAAEWLNRTGLGQYLVQMDFVGMNTIIVMRMQALTARNLNDLKVIYYTEVPRGQL